ncbi:hypothetical protein WR25_08504 [Diploscapter pachys]|uniref:EB domain-containing protein n=1 Tax=Diploscapter pachys TaxID=2018661 RepID=A0A2A2LFS0_9BILA|nr:hypothetical protein WR25_08504 [Diploscapter pachys]
MMHDFGRRRLVSCSKKPHRDSVRHNLKNALREDSQQEVSKQLAEKGSAIIGARCNSKVSCSPGEFCNVFVCRRDNCLNTQQCQKGEICQNGNVNGKMKQACFLFSIVKRVNGNGKETPMRKESAEHYCPGGGAVVVNSNGKLAACDLTTHCTSTHICNPQHGICCTKIRTCPRPTKTIMNAVTGKPVMCQIKNGRVMPCPGDGYCEKKTGFCCQMEKKPTVDGSRENNEDNGTTKRKTVERIVLQSSRRMQWKCCLHLCECPTEFGYTVAPDGKTCLRARRRLREKCKSDMECSAAFSECATGGCRCKKGFQRDGSGGCKPIEYRCVNRGEPMRRDEKLVTCALRASTIAFRSLKNSSELMKINAGLIEETKNVSLSMLHFHGNDRDNCPEDYYCVPVFDDATRPGYYQGFCCPAPSETKPVCPVGEPHESSFPPDYGCQSCPSDYFCHRDNIATDKALCCPKPCVSLEDIYHDGQCYSMAYYGDSCHISAQCVYTKNTALSSSEEYSELAKMECARGICSCPDGFYFADGECKRIMCTIGLRGEPSVDGSGLLIRCSRSADCSQGHMCDPNTHVCCKGINRCPKDHVETGELCTNSECKEENEMCHRLKDGKLKVCCVLDDTAMNDAGNSTKQTQHNVWYQPSF